MKKTLLSLAMLLGLSVANAQVLVYVQEPGSQEGPLEFALGTGWTLSPDMNDPANAVTGTVVVAEDSLGCDALTNGAAISGNIALIYRGTCEFGAKALNAQNAGAIAVILVNNVPGAPIPPGEGTTGGNQVYIPVVMITMEAAATLRPEIDLGNVVVYIGTNQNVYEYNVGFQKADVIVPYMSGTSSLLVANAGEYSMPLGGWVRNYGSQTQAGATLHATVVQDGTTLYDESVAVPSLNSGDSAGVDLPPFEQDSYEGFYTITYTIETPETEEFPADNSQVYTFNAGSVLSYAPVDETSGLPISSTVVIPAADSDDEGFRSCIRFSNDNAERVVGTGLHVHVGTASGVTLNGNLATATVYIWNNEVVDYVARPASDDELETMATGLYELTEADQNTSIWIPFEEPVYFTNGVQYLACLETYDDVVRHGWDNTIDPIQSLAIVNQPQSCIYVSMTDTWYNGFTGLEGPPAIGLQLVDANTVGVKENGLVDIQPYPNPANDLLRIPTGQLTGKASLEVMDLAGRMVTSNQVQLGGAEVLTVDLRSYSNGSYVFRMQFENGQRAAFNVVVNR
ncbi:MAG TPA: PA domain-containing protein [Flavobacteriales bacterium]